MVIGIAFLLPWPGLPRARGCWLWALGGLLLGTILNPYFPSTLVMSWIHLKLALGIGAAPGMLSGTEVQAISLRESIHYFGFLPLALAGYDGYCCGGGACGRRRSRRASGSCSCFPPR